MHAARVPARSIVPGGVDRVLALARLRLAAAEIVAQRPREPVRALLPGVAAFLNHGTAP